MKNKSVKQKGSFMKNKKIQFFTAIVLLICIVIAGVVIAVRNSKDEATYRETTVAYGNLTVGITESGTVEIGTVEQTFDLDMSALQRVTTSNSNLSSSSGNSFGGGMGGMSGMGGNTGGSSNTDNLFGQMFNMGGSSTSSSSSSSSKSDSNLVIKSIDISVGQKISEGDVILTLESEGVDELKDELKSNVDKASADLEALIADQKLSTITADYTLKNALTYGEYAELEKNATISSLTEDVSTANETLAEAKKLLQRYEEQLAQAKSDYNNAVTVMNNAVWVRDNSDKENGLYNYTQAFTSAQSAISNAESLESKVSQLEERVEQAKSNVSKSETNLAKAKRAYDTGVLSAEETYNLRMLAYNTADETYDITISYLEDSLAEQQETYDETMSKWEEFTTYIDGESIRSKYNGVVTDISLAAGDALSTGAVVVTLYDAEAVTMTVTVDEADMTDIALDGMANISLTAYPDEIYEAVVTEIDDAQTDKSGNTTYDVTVTVKGDVSKLFQGMTGDVTFITKQISDITYVNNRAIIRETGVSYVKVKNENGSIETVKVETGFSDGVNVEIIEGLTEGQIVIIEKGDTK